MNLGQSEVFYCIMKYTSKNNMKFMATMNALDRLRKAANLDPIKKEVTLSDGSLFVMYVTPLTMAERERQVRSDDSNGFALQLLINKALDENGTKLFNAGEIDVLKNEVKDSDLQSLMLAVINAEEEESIDPKS